MYRSARSDRPCASNVGLGVACALVAVLALSGCNQAPALLKVELDAAVMPEKHPQVKPEVASNCRACHREQPPVAK
ncbi:MAG: hypothetical protein HGB10_04185 [Coriobacteriia bacterium]|nr:hypothetical protein [Coriobacteriia bacterium]